MSETIRRVSNRTSGFTIMSNACLQRPDLSARAKGLWAYLMTLPDDWKIYKTELEQHFTEGRDALGSAFKELVDAGYIKPQRLTDEHNRFAGYDYTVYEEPETASPQTASPQTASPQTASPQTDFPQTDFPQTDFPQTVFPYTGNPQLLKTNNIPKTNNTKAPSSKRIQPPLPQDTTPEPTQEKRFQRPTPEEVKAYCDERKNNIDPQAFVDYYEARDWRTGNSRIKDWKACVRTWEAHERKRNEGRPAPAPRPEPEKMPELSALDLDARAKIMQRYYNKE